ncbi:uncharacterized protein [Hyperolius riggenbachi]|uniref:uncharacterized protein n=1 Tax=Hyperolius riggenbachi TaxID=752182 RepID=UPI0035A2CEF4
MPVSDDQADHAAPGLVIFGCTSNPVGIKAYQNTTVEDAGQMGQTSKITRQRNDSRLSNQNQSGMVADGTTSHTRQTMVTTDTKDPNDGRESVRMGGARGNLSGSGCMESIYDTAFIELQRTDGCKNGNNQHDTPSKSMSRSDSVGQCNCCFISESPRRHQIQETVILNSGDTGYSRTRVTILDSSSLERGIKCSGGSIKQGTDYKYRMVSEPKLIPDNSKQMGRTTGGLVCQQVQQKVQTVLFPQCDGQTISNRCPGSRLESEHTLCFPAVEFDSSGTSKVDEITVPFDTNCPELAQEGLVSTPSFLVSEQTVGNTGIRKYDTGTRPGCNKFRKMETYSVVSERTVLESKGLSARVVNTLLKSRKENTRLIYQKYWKTFNLWLENSNFHSTEMATILEFLQEGVEKGLALSTIKVQISALSVYLDKKLALDPLIIRFVKSIERNRPVMIKQFPKWDLSLVLQALTSKEFDEDSLRMCTLKTVFLVAITSARRISELHALSCKEPYCSFFNDRVVLRTSPEFLPKVGDMFHRTQEIILPSFCTDPKTEKESRQHKLDVRENLMTYLDKVKDFRKSEALFINYASNSKGLKASTKTIAKWIKDCIIQAYSIMGKEPPENLKAHSTRAAATTWAYRAGTSPLNICKAATWKNLGTFMRHYRLDRITETDQDFGRTVLKAVSPP